MAPRCCLGWGARQNRACFVRTFGPGQNTRNGRAGNGWSGAMVRAAWEHPRPMNIRAIAVVVIGAACTAVPPEFDGGSAGGSAGGAASGGSAGGVAGGSAGGASGGVAGGSGDAGVACPGCAGCCANGVCRVGSASIACGTGGMTCDVCDDGERCDGTRCVLSCDVTTCPSGCCRGGACLDGGVDLACGTSGAACRACGVTEHCWAAACEPFIRINFSYARDAPGCSSNPNCAFMRDFQTQRADDLAARYADAGCLIIQNPPQPNQPIVYALACDRLCNIGSVGGCCGRMPAGTSRDMCAWTPPP